MSQKVIMLMLLVCMWQVVWRYVPEGHYLNVTGVYVASGVALCPRRSLT